MERVTAISEAAGKARIISARILNLSKCEEELLDYHDDGLDGDDDEPDGDSESDFGEDRPAPKAMKKAAKLPKAKERISGPSNSTK